MYGTPVPGAPCLDRLLSRLLRMESNDVVRLVRIRRKRLRCAEIGASGREQPSRFLCLLSRQRAPVPHTELAPQVSPNGRTAIRFLLSDNDDVDGDAKPSQSTFSRNGFLDRIGHEWLNHRYVDVGLSVRLIPCAGPKTHILEREGVASASLRPISAIKPSSDTAVLSVFDQLRPSSEIGNSRRCRTSRAQNVVRFAVPHPSGLSVTGPRP